MRELQPDLADARAAVDAAAKAFPGWSESTLGPADERGSTHDWGPCREADSQFKIGISMTANRAAALTIDTHHHVLPDFFWQETQNTDAPVGGLWSGDDITKGPTASGETI